MEQVVPLALGVRGRSEHRAAATSTEKKSRNALSRALPRRVQTDLNSSRHRHTAMFVVVVVEVVLDVMLQF